MCNQIHHKLLTQLRSLIEKLIQQLTMQQLIIQQLTIQQLIIIK